MVFIEKTKSGEKKKNSSYFMYIIKFNLSYIEIIKTYFGVVKLMDNK